MTEPKLPVIFTPKAHAQAYDRLGWKTAELRGYLSALSSGRYYCSEWCYTPGHNIPHACDAYIMGFNRITGKESPHFHPWVYVKFGLIGPDFKKLAVFSAHPEGQYQEE